LHAVNLDGVKYEDFRNVISKLVSFVDNLC